MANKTRDFRMGTGLRERNRNRNRNKETNYSVHDLSRSTGHIKVRRCTARREEEEEEGKKGATALI